MNDLLDSHNLTRRAYNKPILSLNHILQTIAISHCNYQASNNVMSHDRAGDGTFLYRATTSGYKYVSIAENIAMGVNTLEDVMLMWMGSPQHKANILGNFTNFGGAMVYSKHNIAYWTTVFGRQNGGI